MIYTKRIEISNIIIIIIIIVIIIIIIIIIIIFIIIIVITYKATQSVPISEYSSKFIIYVLSFIFGKLSLE